MSRRIRSIKPELLEDEKTAGLSDTAFRIFIGLITMADDFGTFRADARFVEKQVYWLAVPELGVATALLELERVGLVMTYAVRGQKYGQFRNWAKHQRVDNAGKRGGTLPGPELADGLAVTRGDSRRDENLVRELAAGSGSGSGSGLDLEGRGSDAREIREEPRSEARLKSVPPLPPDPPEAAADDLRWSPERSEDSATRKGAGKSAVASGESGYDLARRVFSEAWAKHYREPYAFGGGPFFGPQSEDVNLRDIGDLALDRDRAKADDLLRHVAKNYMRDKKPLFVNERHPARYFGVDLMNKYGAPPKQKCQLRAASATETQLQPVVGALAPDAVANLTSGFLAKIGKAGGT